jgi:hypothetical protein
MKIDEGSITYSYLWAWLARRLFETRQDKKSCLYGWRRCNLQRTKHGHGDVSPVTVPRNECCQESFMHGQTSGFDEQLSYKRAPRGHASLGTSSC